MAGILDSKSRIMDIIITEEGKRQASQGELRVKYASFTDRHTFYQEDPDNLGVAEDHSNRIFFEAMTKDQDRIIVETEEVYSLDGAPEGRMLPFNSEDFSVVGGTIVSGSVSSIAGLNVPTEYAPGQFAGSVIVSGSELINTGSKRVLDSITRHFADQMIISDRDPFSDTSGFEITTTTAPGEAVNVYNDIPTFSISDFSPFSFEESDLTGGKTGTLESSESFFTDRKLQHLPNFRFLPPLNEKLPSEKIPSVLGRYPNTQQTEILTVQELDTHLSEKPYIDVNFSVTSRDNNIIAQVFEFSESKVKKLSVIDFGEFPDEEPFSPGKRVYFVGKIYKDMYGHLTFINMFTVVFD
jgi:hypothetical protein